MAQPLPWNESFALGHQGLDAEHRHLVGSINEIRAAICSHEGPDQLANLLKALRDVAVEHIRHENSILWQIRSGTYEPLQTRARTQPFLDVMAKVAFDKHMDEHDQLLARLDTIIDGPVDTLSNELKAWFIDHAHGYDADLRAIFQAAGQPRALDQA
jgi:hemerythrin-like metal-binding protein